jgi:iron complex transport system substrate-binding protein
LHRALLPLCLVLLLAGPVFGRELVDQVGRRVVMPETLTRVVSLAPNLTEASYEVNGGAALVGATRFATHPASAAALPRVGSYVNLDIERIVSLKPQLCLAIRDGNPKAVVERLEQLGIPVYVFDPKNLEEVIDVLVRLGELFGTEQSANLRATDYRQRLERVDRLVRQVEHRPRVFFQIDTQPVISAGRDTFLDRLLTRAGAVNLAGGRNGYPRYSWEELLALAPEVVLLASMGGGQSDAELRADWLAWPQIPAVAKERLFVVDSDLFDRPSARLIDALEYLLRLLHPEFGSLPP